MSLGLRGLWVLSVVAVLSGCQPDEVADDLYQVPAEVQPYVERFVEEAAARGRTLSVEGLNVGFAETSRTSASAGMCHHLVSGRPQIVLDTNTVNWKNGDASREILIFHELAHCLLGRTHRDDRLPNGNYASMMRSEGDPVYGFRLNRFKRSYYLDELFDEETPHPWWASDMRRYNSLIPSQKEVIFEENFFDNRHTWPVGESAFTRRELTYGAFHFQAKDQGAYLMTKYIPFDTQKDFELEVRMKVASGDHPVMLHWGGVGEHQQFYLGFTSEQYAFAGAKDTGTAVGRTFAALSPRDYNLLTIRKIQGRYYFYVNQQFFDVGMYEPLTRQQVGFYVGASTHLIVDGFKVSYLQVPVLE